ncbi:MAG: RpiB/LacA/LacB family sugar-phosphate isomerase, partial [Clostridium sp.]|nr:RpiB/LacA/LacB family sugar-phosphate isomerase [Clostridium sp.]
MKVLIGSDKAGSNLKNYLKEYLKKEGHEVIDKTEDEVDFVDSADRVCKGILSNEGDRGI